MVGLVGIAMYSGGMTYPDALELVERVAAERPDADWREVGSAVDEAARSHFPVVRG